MQNEVLGFIGCGHMASAIINSIKTTDIIPLSNVYIYDIDKVKTAYFVEKGFNEANSIEELTKKCSIIFLCIRPQSFSQISLQMKTLVTYKNLFVSIMAGISSSYIQKEFTVNCPVIRAMPNTPLQIGKGATAISRTENVSDEQFSFVSDIFSSCGVVSLIDESHMDAVVAVNGSSPAYIYLFAKTVVEYARSKGIDEEAALSLFSQTLIGSAEMLLKSNKSPQQLIDDVAVSGGTTAAAMQVFYDSGFAEIIASAMESCTKRSIELGEK